MNIYGFFACWFFGISFIAFGAINLLIVEYYVIHKKIDVNDFVFIFKHAIIGLILLPSGIYILHFTLN